jgi:perosamine synthetase
MKNRWPQYSEQAHVDVAQAVQTNSHIVFSQNPWIEEIEERVRTLFRRRFCVAVNSGTAGLTAALRALDLPVGARVAAPAYTFFATVTSMLPLGLVPKLADLDPRTLNVSAQTMIDAAGTDARAMIVTHNWGNAIARDELRAMKARGLPVIDDCSHMFGTRPDAAFFASPGPTDISVVSAGARKIISGGAGGFVLTDDAHLYDRVLAFCQPSRARSYQLPATRASYQYMTGGANFRMSGLAAVLIADQLRHLDGIREAWMNAASDVIDRVADTGGFTLPAHDSATTCWYKVPVICPDASPRHVDMLRSVLEPLEVGVDPALTPFFELGGFPYAHPVSGYPHYAKLRRRIRTLDLSTLVAHRFRETSAA